MDKTQEAATEDEKHSKRFKTCIDQRHRDMTVVHSLISNNVFADLYLKRHWGLNTVDFKCLDVYLYLGSTSFSDFISAASTNV